VPIIIFGKVTAEIKWCSFFAPQCTIVVAIPKAANTYIHICMHKYIQWINTNSVLVVDNNANTKMASMNCPNDRNRITSAITLPPIVKHHFPWS